MDSFHEFLGKSKVDYQDSLTRSKLTTLQVNMGNLCNQSCLHCHVEASPTGDKIMNKEVIDEIINFLSSYKITTLDITGGAPELNPNFDYFVEQARSLVEELIVRSNLTVLFEQGKEYLSDFYKKHQVHLICSLPCYLESNVNAQRGDSVFQKSVEALQLLNENGYAKNHKYRLDLVYNPVGASLPPSQDELERDYKERLKMDHGICFDHLFTITNVPIKRFKEQLLSQGEYEKYCSLLKENFNPNVLDNLMCKSYISVAYDGLLYDCDFNQAISLVMKDQFGNPLTIKNLKPDELLGKDIIMGEHCLSCMAGSGSSCQGAIVDEKQDDVKKYVKQSVKDCGAIDCVDDQSVDQKGGFGGCC